MSDSRSQKPVTSRNFNDVTPIGLVMSPATSSAQHERISCILLLSSERKIVNKLCFFCLFLRCKLFAPISRLNKHAELLKIHFKLLIRKLKFSPLVAKSD